MNALACLARVSIIMSGEQHCPCKDRESRISQFNTEAAARTADIRGPKERLGRKLHRKAATAGHLPERRCSERRSEVGGIYIECCGSKTTGDVQLWIFLDESLGDLLLSSGIDDIR